MKALKCLSVAAVLGHTLLSASSVLAYGRSYYYGWTYYPQNSTTTTSTTTSRRQHTDYSYHYCIYYPSQPRYVYYYNPYTKLYWGRYDLEQRGIRCWPTRIGRRT